MENKARPKLYKFMNKTFILVLMAMMLPLSIFAQTRTTVIDKEWTLGADWSTGSQVVDPALLKDLAEDDKIEINITSVNVSDDSWPQVMLSYIDANDKWNNWSDIDPHSAGLWGINSFPYTAIISFTKTMVNDIKAGKGLLIRGMGYTANKATFVHYDPLPAGTIWQGETVMPASWGAWQTIPASKFADAKAGWTLRLMTKDVGAGAYAQLSSTAWNALDGKSFGGRYCDFTLTEALATELKTNGVYINGCNYTLTAVKLFDPSAVVTYSTALNITQPDWTWTDTKPSVSIDITNPSAEAVTIPVEVELSTDHGVAVNTYSQNVTLAASEKNHTATFTLDDINDPGIYCFSAYVNEEIVKYTRPEDNAYTWTSLNIAYKPTEISSPADAQSDFAEYWQAAKDQLKAIDMNAQLTLVETGKYRNLYTVTLSSIPNGTSGDPVLIRGYYAEPIGEGTYPCIINYQGYDSDGTSSVWHPTADSNPNYAELIISARGQSFGNRDPYKADNIYCNTGTTDTDDNIAGGHWFTYHFGDKDSYYYRGAYMDQVRGIDFVCSREKVNKNNIFCTGGSQGGAFTIVAAALSDGRVNAIAPAIQFMGDFPDYFQVGTWPVSEAKNAALWKDMEEDEMYKFLSYYDTKNFASMITAPTLSSIGLQDNVCPAHTNLAPYNLLTCEKVLYINKNLVHETPNDNTWSTKNNSDGRDWTALTTLWWQSHMKTTGINEIENGGLNADNSRCYNTVGQHVSANTKGIIISNGKKIVKK